MPRVGVALVVGLAVAGCQATDAYEFPAAGSAGSARPTPTVSGSSAWAVPPPPDPAVLRLATEVSTACPLIQGSFGSCVVLRKWTSPTENVFQGHRADATLLDLLGSTDERMRVLASHRKYWDEATILGSRETAERVIALAEKPEPQAAVRARLLDDVMKIDFAKLDLGDRLKQFISKADTAVREEIPRRFLRSGTAQPIQPGQREVGLFELVGALLHDSESAVRQAAFRELATLTSDPARSAAVCKVLVDALDPALELTDDLIASFSTLPVCTETPPRFVDRIEAAMKSPKTVTENASRMYPNVLRGICTRGSGFVEGDPATKKRAFDLARDIAKTKSFDVYGVRAPAIDALVACDGTAASAVLQKLMQDPDPIVDQLAKEAYDRLNGVYEY